MFSSNRVRDPRLHSSPAVYRHGNGLVVEALLLPPARLTAAFYLVFLPLRSVARVLLTIFGLWAAGAYAKLWPWPDSLPFNWLAIVIGAATVLGVWMIERVFRFPLTLWLLGRRLRVAIGHDVVAIGRGLFSRRFPRDQRIAFIHVPIPSASSPIYQNSQHIAVVVGDNRRENLTECYGIERARAIVANLNHALALAHADNDRETDIGERRS